MKKDVPATEAARFADKRSYICWDGREILFGEDWKRRKLELFKRSGGMCERGVMLKKAHEPQCFGGGGEPHHIKPRRDGRDDRLSNLANLSHWCHAAEDHRRTRFGEGRGAWV